MPIASILITNIIIGISIIGLNLVFPVHDLIEIKSNPLPAIPKKKMDSKNVLWILFHLKWLCLIRFLRIIS